MDAVTTLQQVGICITQGSIRPWPAAVLAPEPTVVVTVRQVQALLQARRS